MDLNSGNSCQMNIFRFFRPHTVSAASVLQDTIFNLKFSWISFRIFLFQVIKLNDVGHLVDKFEYISDPDDLTGLNDLISHENLSDLDDLDCLFDFKKIKKMLGIDVMSDFLTSATFSTSLASTASTASMASMGLKVFFLQKTGLY